MLAENLLGWTRVHPAPVQSRRVYERPGYRTLLGRLRSNVRAYIGKQLELPRQEIAEIIAANLRAAAWFGAAAALGLVTLMLLVVLLVALLALIPREWLGIAVLGLAAGSAVVLLIAGFRGRMAILGIVGALLLIAIGVVAYLYLPELVLAALLLLIAAGLGTGAMAYGGFKRLELHGPTRTMNSVKETIRWAKARLLGRSAS